MKTQAARAALLVCFAASYAWALDDPSAERVLDFAKRKVEATAAALPATVSPKSTRSDGSWTTVPNTDLIGWTQGFFPAVSWYLFDATGDASWRTRADQWTRPLELQKTNTQTHDLGFKMLLSFGHAYQSTGDPYYLDVTLTSAASLATRYDPAVGAILMGEWNPDWSRPVVIDTMINIELLLWAADHGGDPRWRQLALNHALTTERDLVRPDGSTYHVADYFPETGELRWQGTFQGYSDSSTWARGQAWAIYGFSMVYRYTRDPRMLAAAQKVTEYYLSRLGADAVPNWDFDAPSQVKDSSTAAIVSSALFELSGLVADLPTQQRYLAEATRALDVLASAEYLSEGTAHQSILLHGVGNFPARQEVDVGLIYGDYYFVEALQRRPSQSTDGGARDAGVVADAGYDAGFASDAGLMDAGVPIDGGASADAGPSEPIAEPPSGNGGGCAVAGGGLVGLLSLLLLVLRSKRASTSR